MAKERKPESEELRSVRARQRALGRELRRMYESVVREPLPEEFVELLSRIDEVEKSKKN